jgi:hypothetical protein
MDRPVNESGRPGQRRPCSRIQEYLAALRELFLVTAREITMGTPGGGSHASPESFS